MLYGASEESGQQGVREAGGAADNPGGRRWLRTGETRSQLIFTNTQGTLAALETAGTLADGLGARIKLMVPQAEPYAYPLDRAALLTPR